MIQELITRYHNLLLTGKYNPYYENKLAWEISIREKVKELEEIVKTKLNDL